MSYDSPLPVAVRVKEARRLAGCGLTEFYKRLNNGIYECFLDGRNRLVVVESIFAHQRRQLEATRGTPRAKPSMKVVPRRHKQPAAANQPSP
jgi:hypothetical protein